ncbi:MAG: hypothetical protein SOZ52_04850 [Pyramidobacter sp.]|nr:hypothetical protein [Pyramidobacter sp.]
MTVRSSLVESIHAEYVKIGTDFPVNMEELARTEDGSWYGMVRSHIGSTVELIPLDSPESLHIGTPLYLTGHALEDHLSEVKAGTVIDPLGRVLLTFSQPSAGNAGVRGDDFWGLSPLSELMQMKAGEGVALLGTPSGGFSVLFSQIAAAQSADTLYIFCQGGQKDLHRFCRAAASSAAKSSTVILWTPPWATPALKVLASSALGYLIKSRHNEGRRLILIDDLRLWLESVREYGESSEELLLPDGYPHMTRRLLGEILDLTSAPDELGNSTSIIAGWRYEEGISAVVEQPYMGRLPRFMRTGIVLEEHSEYVLPSEDSWGTLSPAGRCWRELQSLYASCDEENRHVLELLSRTFCELFVEFSLLSRPVPSKELVQFCEADENALLEIGRRALPQLAESIASLRLDVQLHYREESSVRKKIFLAWIHETLRSGEALA